MARKTTLVKHSNPFNRELRLDTGMKLQNLRVKKFGKGRSALITAALEVGMDPSQLARYERGEVLPSLPVLANILSVWKSNWKEFHE